MAIVHIIKILNFMPCQFFLRSVLGPGQEIANKGKRPHTFLATQDNVYGMHNTFGIIHSLYILRRPSLQGIENALLRGYGRPMSSDKRIRGTPTQLKTIGNVILLQDRDSEQHCLSDVNE
jgi:hypothetical protein